MARFLLGVAAKGGDAVRVQEAAINGAPLVFLAGDEPIVMVVLTVVDGGRIARVDLVLAPDKLARSVPR